MQKLSREYYKKCDYPREKLTLCSVAIFQAIIKCMKDVKWQIMAPWKRYLLFDFQSWRGWYSHNSTYINHIVQKSKKRAVVLSNDTDVVLLLLHYVHRSIDMGLAEMWISYCTGENIRFIPIHLLYEILGP